MFLSFCSTNWYKIVYFSCTNTILSPSGTIVALLMHYKVYHTYIITDVPKYFVLLILFYAKCRWFVHTHCIHPKGRNIKTEARKISFIPGIFQADCSKNKDGEMKILSGLEFPVFVTKMCTTIMGLKYWSIPMMLLQLRQIYILSTVHAHNLAHWISESGRLAPILA